MDDGPIFADPSGRRHRALRMAGLGVAVMLAVCLGAVALAVTGGPRAPFTQWAVPSAAAKATGAPGASRPEAGSETKAAGGPGGTAPAATAPGTIASSPTVRPAASPSPSPTASQTPPGRQAVPRGQTKSPNPHKSSSGA